MAYLGKINGGCAEETSLTGKSNCSRNEGKTVGLIITSLNAKYPIDADVFRQNLEGYVADTTVLRMLPIKDIVENTIAGGDIATSTIGFGPTMPTGLNAADEIYRIDAGICLYKELSKLNRRNVRVFRVDDQGYIYGTVIEQGGTEYFAGFEASVYSYSEKSTGNDAPAGIYLRVFYSVNYESEYINANAFEIKMPDGLVGVTLKKGSATDTAKVIEDCSGEDLTSAYSWNVSMFIDSDGNAPTSVTYDPFKEELTFVPSGSYQVQKAAALQLEDIFGMEGVNCFVDLA